MVLDWLWRDQFEGTCASGSQMLGDSGVLSWPATPTGWWLVSRVLVGSGSLPYVTVSYKPLLSLGASR